MKIGRIIGWSVFAAVALFLFWFADRLLVDWNFISKNTLRLAPEQVLFGSYGYDAERWQGPDGPEIPEELRVPENSCFLVIDSAFADFHMTKTFDAESLCTNGTSAQKILRSPPECNPIESSFSEQHAFPFTPAWVTQLIYLAGDPEATKALFTRLHESQSWTSEVVSERIGSAAGDTAKGSFFYQATDQKLEYFPCEDFSLIKIRTRL